MLRLVRPAPSAPAVTMTLVAYAASGTVACTTQFAARGAMTAGSLGVAASVVGVSSAGPFSSPAVGMAEVTGPPSRTGASATGDAASGAVAAVGQGAQYRQHARLQYWTRSPIHAQAQCSISGTTPMGDRWWKVTSRLKLQNPWSLQHCPRSSSCRRPQGSKCRPSVAGLPLVGVSVTY